MKSATESTAIPQDRERQLAMALYSGGARIVSILIAISLSALLLVNPLALVQNGQVHVMLASVWMWSMTASYVHGIGYIPRHIVLRILFCPLFAWLAAAAFAITNLN